MITTKTVFVIGAGASAPYGLPLGTDLIRLARHLQPDSELFKLLAGLYSVKDVRGCIDDLRQSPVASIDKFLQDRQEHPTTQTIGRSIIAAVMGSTIATHRASSHQPDWIEELLHRMAEGVSSLDEFQAKNTGVTVVSFNFDNVVEDRVTMNLRRRYPHAGKDSATAAASSCPVLHIHGRLSDPPSDRIWDGFGVTRTWVEWLDAATRDLRLVHDASVDTELLERAVKALDEARVVIWLGLQFHVENLNRLRVGQRLLRHYQSVFGSAKGLPNGTREWVELRVDRIRLGTNDDTCLDVLRNFNWRV